MDQYQDYKPLRNLFSKFHLQKSLEDLWWFAQVLEGELPMARIKTDNGLEPISKYLYQWDIPIICRELILNASNTGKKRLKGEQEFRETVNKLRSTDDAMGKYQNPDEAYLSLHPNFQQQLPWQQKRNLNGLMRAYKIYSTPAIDRLLIQETKIPAKVWLFVGFAVAGNMLKDAGIKAFQDYTFAGIEKEQSDALFRRISITFENLKEITTKTQIYDSRWKFTPNPMLSWPLLSLQKEHPEQLHCPVPAYVLERVSSGLYYDLVKIKGFENPLGESFEAYTGEILRLTFPAPRFNVLEQQPYQIGKNKKAGTDWLVLDEQANLFIECKAKRMSNPAKVSSDPMILYEQVDFLAKAILQVYKNIGDALQGHTHWKPNGLPIYPLILTLEEWYLVGPAFDLLKKAVEDRMSEAKMNMAWLVDMPYSVISCAEFEVVSPTMAIEGLGVFFGTRFSSGEQAHIFRMFAQNHFPESYRATAYRFLFQNEWPDILPRQALPPDLAGLGS